MTVLAVLQESSRELREKSEPVGRIGDEIRELCWDMNETVQSRGALGIAAVQVGVPIRLILIRDGQGSLIAMANPVLVRALNRDAVLQEGCLSIGNGAPRRFIKRPAKCEVEWMDLAGHRKAGNFTGMAARIILHELDHLDGILMTDHPAMRG